VRAQFNVIDVVPRVPREWTDAEYRHSAVEANVSNMIAWQVRINREERGMKQAELAARMGTQQPAISRLEDPEQDVRVSTLLKAAAAFDCALLVRFVDHHEFAAAVNDVRPERLYACSFDQLSLQFDDFLKVRHGDGPTDTER
jgi:transcriptional regulator with XRE-family HTH domain